MLPLSGKTFQDSNRAVMSLEKFPNGRKGRHLAIFSAVKTLLGSVFLQHLDTLEKWILNLSSARAKQAQNGRAVFWLPLALPVAGFLLLCPWSVQNPAAEVLSHSC